jgi:sec-independent protein translocase protein TatA
MMLGMFLGVPGWVEIAIFGVIILLVFGNRLPGVMKSLGRSVVEFKKGASDAESDSPDNGDDDRKDT